MASACTQKETAAVRGGMDTFLPSAHTLEARASVATALFLSRNLSTTIIIRSTEPGPGSSQERQPIRQCCQRSALVLDICYICMRPSAWASSYLPPLQSCSLIWLVMASTTCGQPCEGRLTSTEQDGGHGPRQVAHKGVGCREPRVVHTGSQQGPPADDGGAGAGVHGQLAQHGRQVALPRARAEQQEDERRHA